MRTLSYRCIDYYGEKWQIELIFQVIKEAEDDLKSEFSLCGAHSCMRVVDWIPEMDESSTRKNTFGHLFNIGARKSSLHGALNQNDLKTLYSRILPTIFLT